MLDEREHIPDEFADFLRQLKQGEAGAAGPTTDEQGTSVPGPKYFIDAHVYPLEQEEPGLESSVEGSLAQAIPDQQGNPAPDSESEQVTAPLTPGAPRQRMRLHPSTWVSIAVWLLLALSIGIWYGVVPLLTPTVTVTIVPVSRSIQASGTLTVVTGPADAASRQIPGRLLSTISMSQAKRVPTTGTGHQDAESAHGTITFYNAAPAGQTVSAGTLLTGADGVQVVTDAEAIIPAGNLATNGQATVPAHAVLPGPAGNIAAHDIYGPCCRLNVFAANSAFTGGQVARVYPMVTTHDVSAAAESLEKSLTVSMQAAFAPQVRSDETLITPLPCQPTVTPDHPAGTEAGLVQVTVSLVCTGEAYPTGAYEVQVTQMVMHAAAEQLGPGYEQTGTIQSSITATTYRPHGAVTLMVKAAGTWTYQINEQQRAAMVERIIGKSKAQATALLLAMPGVQSAAIEGGHGDQLPGDASRIQVIIVAY